MSARRALLSVLAFAVLAAVFAGCTGEDTVPYERGIEDILSPVTALNAEIGEAISAIASSSGGQSGGPSGVSALIDLRNNAVALEMEAGQALHRLQDMDIPSGCREFHDLLTAAMAEFELMGAEYAAGADIFAEGRGEELIDVAALDRANAHLQTAEQKLNEASGAPADACSG